MIEWVLPELEPYRLVEIAPPDLPYADLELDTATRDVAFPPRIIKGVDAVIQRIRVRFRFFLGEWFLDQRLGVPYYRDVLIKNPDTLVISTVFRGVLLSTPGVRRVEQFQAILDRAARRLDCTFAATLDDGTRIIAQAEPFIIASTL